MLENSRGFHKALTRISIITGVPKEPAASVQRSSKGPKVGVTPPVGFPREGISQEDALGQDQVAANRADSVSFQFHFF
jgi:hypothetical protein